MYKMYKEAGYDITIKKILEFKQKEIFKGYIEFLYFKKKTILFTKEKNQWNFV